MRLGLGMCVILMLALWSSATIAFADSGGATATVNPGSLSEAGNFGSASAVTKLDGTDKDVPYVLPIQVTDATGSGAGWNLQISGTPLSDGPHVLTQQVLNAGGGCAPGSSCTPPQPGQINYPVNITNTALKFFDAALGSGLGKFALSMMVSVQIPLNTEPGTYTSTIILTIANGP